jgi:hypothetical protein
VRNFVQNFLACEGARVHADGERQRASDTLGSGGARRPASKQPLELRLRIWRQTGGIDDQEVKVPKAAARAQRINDVQRTVAWASAILLLAAALFAPIAARASDLVVAYDQSQLLRLPRPVASVIIGNPSIADVAVQGGNLLVVTGKTFGVTNIIALDADRNIIQDQRVIVTRDEARIVNLSKGGLRQSYSCTPNCSPTLTIGDDTAYFDMISKHASTKTKFSEGTDSRGDTQQ